MARPLHVLGGPIWLKKKGPLRSILRRVRPIAGSKGYTFNALWAPKHIPLAWSFIGGIAPSSKFFLYLLFLKEHSFWTPYKITAHMSWGAFKLWRWHVVEHCLFQGQRVIIKEGIKDRFAQSHMWMHNLSLRILLMHVHIPGGIFAYLETLSSSWAPSTSHKPYSTYLRHDLSPDMLAFFIWHLDGTPFI